MEDFTVVATKGQKPQIQKGRRKRHQPRTQAYSPNQSHTQTQKVPQGGMETIGIEPMTSCLQSRRSPS